MSQPRIAAIHRAFPKEMAAIGRLLVDYGDLEILLMHCVSVVRGDLDSTLKAMFRIRGETNRIKIADGLARTPYLKLSLDAEFDEAICAMRQCVKIRNKFAHSYWHNPQQGQALCYVSIEDLADTDDVVTDLDLAFFYLDQPLLDKHEAYFRYTDEILTHVNYEGRLRAGKLQYHNAPKPARLEPPPLYTLKKEHDDPWPC